MNCHITSLILPNSLTSIGNYAFFCDKLLSVESHIEEPFGIEEHVFGYTTYSYGTLCVPSGSKVKYQNKMYWKYFSSIVENSGNTKITPTSLNDIYIFSNNGVITVSGIDNICDVTVYSVSGQMLGTAKANGNPISFSTNLNRGEIAIIKIGERSVKVVMQ